MCVVYVVCSVWYVVCGVVFSLCGFVWTLAFYVYGWYICVDDVVGGCPAGTGGAATQDGRGREDPAEQGGGWGCGVAWRGVVA